MRGAILAGVVVVLSAMLAAPAFGADVQPWDGANPFVCTLQAPGEQTFYEHPDADPFCVEYDKTRQDLTELGLVKILMREPARASAAMDKCWYYQRDHWKGQIVAGDDSTETYRFDGAYFFDKRFGNGGVHLEHFTIDHHTVDLSELPGLPPSWRPYFGPGGGGVMFLGKLRVDANCQPHAGSGHSPYAGPGSHEGAGGGAGGVGAACRRVGGAARRGLGRAHLGQRRNHLTRVLGRPLRSAHGFLHFCVRRGGEVAAHFGRNGRADLLVTDAKSFHAGRARVGASLRAARGALREEHVLGHRGQSSVLEVRRRSWRVLVGARRGRVTFIAVAASRLTARRLGALLLASGY